LYIIYIYIYDSPLRINHVSEPILFADDITVIISSRNLEDLCSVSNLLLSHMIKWFAAKDLVLRLYRMIIMKFITKNSSHSTLHIGCKEKYIEKAENTTFFWLTN
jgi:hypothetical protein